MKIYLDMDGTIADLYNMPHWLERLEKEDATVFSDCKPLITEQELFAQLKRTKRKSQIVILSMTPKNASKKYQEEVIKAKNEWLDKHFPHITKRIYRAYGHNKNLANSKAHILIDDNATIRENYKGIALNPWWV